MSKFLGWGFGWCQGSFYIFMGVLYILYILILTWQQRIYGKLWIAMFRWKRKLWRLQSLCSKMRKIKRNRKLNIMSCIKGKDSLLLSALPPSVFLHLAKQTNNYFGRHERESPTPRSFKQIRPRAETLCPIEDVKVGQMVMANYSMEDPKERGLW